MHIYIHRYTYIYKNEFSISYPERRMKGSKAPVNYLSGLLWIKVTGENEPQLETKRSGNNEVKLFL